MTLDEFDVFKKRDCEREYTYLKRKKLPDLFQKESLKNKSTISRFVTPCTSG